MLIEFSVGNFRSFMGRKTLSLQAAPIKGQDENPTIDVERYKLLRGAVIFGANSSGKSNLMIAMSTMKRLLLESFEKSSSSELGISPFLLHSDLENKPSFFEVIFMANSIRYRYGFEVDNTTVRSEWLYESKKIVEKPLFLREDDGIKVFPAFKEGKNLEEKTRDNTLFLAVVDQYNGSTARTIFKWFTNFQTISGLSHERYKELTFKMLESDTGRSLWNFLSQVDLGFDNIQVVREPHLPYGLAKDTPEFQRKQKLTDSDGKSPVSVMTHHKKFNSNNEIENRVDFDLREHESSGTNKLFNMAGPIFDVLQCGGVLAVDELDASLHPLLTVAITKLFHSRKHNSNNAQLIFTTHDTNLLQYGNYRRDQVYFIQKDPYGASDLYSLVEYIEDGKKIRNDRSFEKDYIQGRYGAIPYIGEVKTLLSEPPS